MNFISDPATVQYVQSIDVVLRLVFCAAARRVLVRRRFSLVNRVIAGPCINKLGNMQAQQWLS
jgi:hypothetical protein